eukprot:CFRG1282T1
MANVKASRYSIILLLSITYVLISYTSAAVIDVQPGYGTLSAAVVAAAPEDSLLLAPGSFIETNTIIFEKPLTIVGSGDSQSYVIFNSSISPIAFLEGETWNVKMDGFSLGDSSTATTCSFARPYALLGNYSIELMAPTVKNNRVNIVSDVGIWHKSRTLKDFYFGTCLYSSDGPTGTVNSMDGGSLAIMVATCRAVLSFSVKFDRLGSCGVNIEDNPTFTIYRVAIMAWFNEYVEYVTDEKKLRLPVERNGNAVTLLKIEIDRVAEVSATISVNYPEADLEAAIVKIDVGAIDGWNQSTVTLQMSLPAPYTVTTGHRGILQLIDLNDMAAVASEYVFGTQCDGLAMDETCAQFIQYNMLACDMTGSYAMMQIPISCQETNERGVEPECPVLENKADIYFTIQTNNFCEITNITLESLFQPTVQLRLDDTYLMDRPEGVPFVLGELSFWAIELWTNSSGVIIADAYVTMVERTSDGDCSLYPNYLANIDADLDQVFFEGSEYSPPEIRMPIPVTTGMACATSDRNTNIIMMNFTMVVDYLDSNGLGRRRRNIISYDDSARYEDRRDAGELSATGETGIVTDNQTVAVDNSLAANTANGSADSGTTPTGIYIAVAFVLILFCCVCCCCLVASVMLLRTKSEKGHVHLSERQSSSSFAQSIPMNSYSTTASPMNSYSTPMNSYSMAAAPMNSYSMTAAPMSSVSITPLYSGTGFSGSAYNSNF